jgi:hypothetical protein
MVAHEFEVWLADGSRVDSRTCCWADVPDGILVVRWWGPRDKGINWGDGIYGDPATHKACAIVDDALFQRVLEEAQATTTRPSERA